MAMTRYYEIVIEFLPMEGRMRTYLWLAIIPGLLFGQNLTSERQFEVASIKPLDMDLGEVLRSGHRSVSVTDTRVDLIGQTLAELIARAWGVPGDQVTKVPESVRPLFFDVQARLPVGSSRNDVAEMLRSLLRERFKLSVRVNEEMRPMYLMALGKGPQKLQGSSAEGPGKCAVEGVHRMCRAMTMGEFATKLSEIGQIGRAASSIAGSGAAAIMEWIIDRPVEDHTGLEGRFDFEFDYDHVGAASKDAPPARVIDVVAALGLRLESTKRSVQTVAIEHVEKAPTEN
jgi:uncharacterized protein (TIGR03435 family)